MTGSAAETGGPTASGDAESHDDHRSGWPIIGAVGAGGLYAGFALAVLAGRTGLLPATLGIAVSALGAGTVVVALLGWLHEAFLADYWQRAGGERARRRYRGTMILFLLTDVATFAAGFVYYFFVRAGAWPPSNLPHLLSSLVLVNTLVLVASSVTVHYAHEALDAGNDRRFVQLLGVTLVLGVGFLVGQVFEYYEFVVGAGFTLTDGVFASAFFGLTGLHGLHVSLGAVLLAIVFVRALRGAYSRDRDTSVATVSLYWHFVDAVWLFLVVVLYVGASVTV
jgi:cytochrome c oxidase subunit 3